MKRLVHVGRGMRMVTDRPRGVSDEKQRVQLKRAHISAVKRDCKCENKTPEACEPGGLSEDKNCYVYWRKPACKCHHDFCETE